MNRKRDLLAAATFFVAAGFSISWIAWPGPAAGGEEGALLAEAASGPTPVIESSLPAEDLSEPGPGEREVLGQSVEVLPAEALPAEEDVAAIPAGAVKLRVLRWPDREPLVGLRVTLIEQARGVVSRVVVPRGGRLRLDDFWLAAPGVIGVRAKGFEPLHLTVDVPADGERERVALLRPQTGFYGRVVDPDGRPVPNVQVAGWWIESPRPFVNEVSHGVLAPGVRARIEPPEFPDFDVEVAQGTVIYSLFDEIDGAPGEVEESEEENKKDAGPPLQFIAAHDVVSATTTTDPAGWFYVEPLGGVVLGQLTLLAETPLGASDVLRVSIPSGAPRLPNIVLHEPRPLNGTVVDGSGAPVAGARVLVQFADGWSKGWPPLITDEDGAFVFEGPVADLALGVEVTGTRLKDADVWKAESADGMWDALAAITPEGSSARELFQAAYGDWTAPLPRARGCVRANAWDGDALLVLESVGSLGLVVKDAEHLFPIEGARVHALHGGWEAGDSVAYTNADGAAAFRLVDREWQPQVVRVSAAGYHPVTFALPPDSCAALHQVRLASIEPETDGGPDPDAPNGLVLDAGGERARARIVVYGSTLPTAKPLWEGWSRSDGTFRYELPDSFRKKLIYFHALAELDGTRQGATLGPVSTGLYASGERVSVRLERGADMSIDLLHLLEGRPYQLEWSLAPFPGAAPIARGALPVPAGTARRERLALALIPGWHATVLAVGATQGNGPALDLTRGAGRRHSFASLRYVWSEWEPVSKAVKVRVPPSGGRVSLVATGPISLSGVVEGMPWMPRTDVVQVAALGERGTWVASVSGNGWFDFRSLPPGRYRLVAYLRPAPDADALTIQGRGEIHGELAVDTKWSRHDLALEWKTGD